jgi:hypothetical protein
MTSDDPPCAAASDDNRAFASAPASALACEHTAGSALSTCLRCRVTSDIRAWITRLTARARGAQCAPASSAFESENDGACSKIFTSTSNHRGRLGKSDVGMYAATV